MSEGGRFHVFSTHSGVTTASCAHKALIHLENWTRGPALFPKLPAWARAEVPLARPDDFWAPDVIKIGSQHRLYYSVSSFGSQVSCIGLAVASGSNVSTGAFLDHGAVICSSEESAYNAIDPCPFVSRTENGTQRHWLTFGSFWQGIFLAELETKTGLIKPGNRTFGPLAQHYSAQEGGIEASYVMPHGGYFFLFVNWGWCCRGVQSTYQIMVGRSRGPTGPYTDLEGRDLATGGGSLFLASHTPDAPNQIGPGQLGIVQSTNATNLFTYHYYDANNGGQPTLGMREMRWSSVAGVGLWPSVGKVVSHH